MNHIPARGHQFFQFFQIFFKVEAMLPFCKSVLFNILYPASANEFFACENSIFLVRAILLLLEIIIKRQQQFFSSSGNVYFNETLHYGQWKQIFWLVKTVVFLFRGFSSQWNPSLKLACGSQLQKKRHILTNVTDFLASGTRFLLFSQTTANCYQWKQFILQLEHIFQSFLHSDQWKRVFCLLETVLFYSEFFLLVETITETWGKSIFKYEIYSCQ